VSDWTGPTWDEDVPEAHERNPQPDGAGPTPVEELEAAIDALEAVDWRRVDTVGILSAAQFTRDLREAVEGGRRE